MSGISEPFLAFMYHRVNILRPDPWTTCVSPAHFEQHLQVIRSLPIRTVITLDDGYADNFENAKPLLEKYDTPALIFVTSGVLDSPYEMWWDELERQFLNQTPPDWHWDSPEMDDGAVRYRNAFLPARQRGCAVDGIRPSARPDRRMMTRDEVAELAAGGLIEIGAHTVTHPVLSALDRHRQRWEIAQSKRDLEQVTGNAVRFFAYPNGFKVDYSEETIRMVQEAGFAGAYAAWDAPFGVAYDQYEIPRVMVRDWDGNTFESLVYDKIGGRA